MESVLPVRRPATMTVVFAPMYWVSSCGLLKYTASPVPSKGGVLEELLVDEDFGGVGIICGVTVLKGCL